MQDRQSRGEQFEGQGGPDDEVNKGSGGYNDNDVVPANVSKGDSSGSSGSGKSQFKGEDYAQSEDVPGSIADQGFEAPDSVTRASRGTEGY